MEIILPSSRRVAPFGSPLEAYFPLFEDKKFEFEYIKPRERVGGGHYNYCASFASLHSIKIKIILRYARLTALAEAAMEDIDSAERKTVCRAKTSLAVFLIV